MSKSTYRLVLEQAQSLPVEEQLQLIEDLIASIRENNQIKPKPRHSIKELSGLGKEVWQAIDVDRYIAEERASWDDTESPNNR